MRSPSTSQGVALAPATAVVLFALGVPLDLWLSWYTSNGAHPCALSLRGCAVAAVSCVPAVVVNLCTFEVIGSCRSGAVTYQVLGHVKTLMLVMGELLLARRSLWSRATYGVVIAALGALAYTREAGEGGPRRCTPAQPHEGGPPHSARAS